MYQFLQNPAFWTGFGCGFTALALLIIVFLLVAVPELRNLRWPALPANLPQPTARDGREERAAEQHLWTRDAAPANEPGVINLTTRIDANFDRSLHELIASGRVRLEMAP